MKEIGSEFAFPMTSVGAEFILPDDVCDFAFSFSGRTSIETVLRNEPQIKKAMLPSYCCDSMLEPFRRAGIEICFYNVNYERGLTVDLQLQADIDALLWCNYFGFNVPMPDVTAFIQSGGIVIEDITHSFLSRKRFHAQSRYLVASLRKWGPLLCGGYCAATQGRLKYKPTKVPPAEFLTEKQEAMEAKTAFLNGDHRICKDEFLKGFANSNHWLAENYSGLAMDDISLKMLAQSGGFADCAARRNNAKALYNGLQTMDRVRFLFPEEKMDCPLFVPIVIEQETRETIRQKLIENQIYCPIHWPKPNAECSSNLYDMELSLICDQRYDVEDMQRIISIIRDCVQ